MLHALWSRLWIICLTAVLGGAVLYGGTMAFVTPQYQASVMMYVNNSSISLGGNSITISSAELSAAERLVDTYLVILESRTTLNEVADKAGVDYSYATLKNMVSAASVNGTEIFQVRVMGPDAEEAAKLANTIAVVLPEKIASVVEGSSVRVVDYAVVSDAIVSPDYGMNTFMGMVIGALLCAAAIVAYELLNDTIRSEDYLTQTYPDIPLLSVVPDAWGRKSSRYYKGRGQYYYRSGYYGKRSRKGEKEKK